MELKKLETRGNRVSPIKESFPTTNPKVRYIMPFDINVTFHYDLEALTVLSICTDS